MDKQTESREAFKKWWNKPEQIELRLSCAEGWGFRIWTASRESLVVALPKREAFECWPHEAYMIEWDEGEYIPYAETAESLRAIGIRIKGEGDGASS